MLIPFLVSVSCLAAAPMRPDTPPALPVPVAQLQQLKSMQDVIAVTLLADGSHAPSGIVLPRLLNRRQTIDYMLVNYPRHARPEDTQTMPIAWVLVDKSGNVADALLVQPSSEAQLDSLAVKALDVAWFTPATIGNDTVAVWLPYPVRVPTREELTAALAALDGDNSQAPRNTPFDEKPVLLNRIQVEEAVVRIIYNLDPRVNAMNEQFARATRVGGKTNLWLYLDETGTVRNVVVKKTSGNTDLDNYARQVARTMRFAPAKLQGKAVEAWIEMPVEFRAR